MMPLHLISFEGSGSPNGRGGNSRQMYQGRSCNEKTVHIVWVVPALSDVSPTTQAEND